MKIFDSRKKKFKLYLTLFASVLIYICRLKSQAQTVVDKTVATVSDGVRTELITYSDLLWQLALQTGCFAHAADFGRFEYCACN